MPTLASPEPSGRPSKADFDDLERRVSVTRALTERGVNPWTVALSVPLGVYLLGLAIAFATGWGRPYLADPVPPVFAVVTFLFLEGAFAFDRRLFDMIRSIEDAFAESSAAFYAFFSDLVECLYEPWPTSETGVPPTHPTRLIFVGLLAYVVLLAVSGVGQPPVNRPAPTAAFFWFMTVVGLAEVVVLLWTVYVMFAYMAVHVTELDVAIDPLRRADNLGLRPYGRFVVSITSRIFLALAVGGFALLTTPSAFTITLFLGGIGLFVVWFVSTQYGLHQNIVEAKARYRRRVRDLVARDDIQHRLTDDPDLESLQNAQVVTEYVHQLDELPDWPVTWQNVLKLIGSIALSFISVVADLENLADVVFA